MAKEYLTEAQYKAQVAAFRKAHPGKSDEAQIHIYKQDPPLLEKAMHAGAGRTSGTSTASPSGPVTIFTKQQDVNLRAFQSARLKALRQIAALSKEDEKKSHIPMTGMPWGSKLAEFKPKVRFEFQYFKQRVQEAWKDTLEEFGKKTISYIKSSMIQGDYRPYLSRRASFYFDKGIVIGKSPAKSPMKAYGRNFILNAIPWEKKRRAAVKAGDLTQAKRLQQRVNSIRSSITGRGYQQIGTDEAYQWTPFGAKYRTGTIKLKPGSVYKVAGELRTVPHGTGKTYTAGKWAQIGVNKVTGEINRKAAGRGLIHWSSRPGMPPAPDTEQLKRFLRYDVEMVGQSYSLKIGAYVPYAKALEHGTRKIKARPFITPAIDIMSRNLSVILRKKYDEASRLPYKHEFGEEVHGLISGEPDHVTSTPAKPFGMGRRGFAMTPEGAAKSMGITDKYLFSQGKVWSKIIW